MMTTENDTAQERAWRVGKACAQLGEVVHLLAGVLQTSNLLIMADSISTRPGQSIITEAEALNLRDVRIACEKMIYAIMSREVAIGMAQEKEQEEIKRTYGYS